MKEITLSFSPDELRELAKQLHLARYFLITCDYDNESMVDDIMTRVCATGFAEAFETDGFRHGGLTETIFTVSTEVDEECEPIVGLYEDDVLHERLPYALADRDFVEQYGKLEPEAILKDPALLTALQNLQTKYVKEFETYGITHLRIEQKR